MMRKASLDKVLLCSPGWPWTPDPAASASQVLGSQAWATRLCIKNILIRKCGEEKPWLLMLYLFASRQEGWDNRGGAQFREKRVPESIRRGTCLSGSVNPAEFLHKQKEALPGPTCPPGAVSFPSLHSLTNSVISVLSETGGMAGLRSISFCHDLELQLIQVHTTE